MERRPRCGRGAAYRLHTLRHTFASMLIAAGENPKAIQTWLGHATISETFDTYGHLYPSTRRLR
ncbi:tyrosine-type recombinase/integrase [Pilimelia anulata]|uniref:tyrosine-type recombinase/integrase n=1 Tax=Pilimelia anulata TaxID=53371 RepID=UPI003570EE23